MSEEGRFTGSDDFRLGETAGAVRVAEARETADAALALARQARHALRIFTRDLDARLYSNADFHAAVSALARRSAYSFVRIVVIDPTPAIRSGHRLIGLVQQLPSHIEVRRAGRDWQDEVSAGLLADDRGLLWRPYGDLFEGTVDFAAGPRALEYRSWFDDAWEHATPDPEFRRLGI